MHDTHEVTGSNPVSPTIKVQDKRAAAMTEGNMTSEKQRKSLVEWIVIVGLAVVLGGIWLYAHWNLSRQPPYHKGPGSVHNPANHSNP